MADRRCDVIDLHLIRLRLTDRKDNKNSPRNWPKIEDCRGVQFQFVVGGHLGVHGELPVGVRASAEI